MLWQFTSKQTKLYYQHSIIQQIATRPKAARLTGVVLCAIATVLFIIKLGWFSGICAAIIGLMGVGCLALALQPFNYLRWSSVMVLYAVSLTLEILI